MTEQRTIQPVWRKLPLRSLQSDLAYWQTQPYSVRLAALEEIRREYHQGQHDHPSRLPGVQFDPCHEAKVEVVIDDTPIDFIDLENLKKSKRAAGRHQDLADLENLES